MNCLPLPEEPNIHPASQPCDSSSLLATHFPLPFPSLPPPWLFAVVWFPFPQKETVMDPKVWFTFFWQVTVKERWVDLTWAKFLGHVWQPSPVGDEVSDLSRVEPNPALEYKEGSRLNKATPSACLRSLGPGPDSPSLLIPVPWLSCSWIWIPGSPDSGLVCWLILAGSLISLGEG